MSLQNVSFGKDQVSRPAPKGYRLFESIYFIVFVPVVAYALVNIPMSAAALKVAIGVSGTLTAAVKSLGALLGDGQDYADIQNPIK